MINVIPEKQHVGNALDDSNEFSTMSGVRYRSSGNIFIAKADLVVMLPVRGRTRSAISHFSDSCGIRMRRYLRECRAEYGHMVTLTYPSDYPGDGRIVKEHLRTFLQRVKRWDSRHNPLAESNFSAFWFLEFQDRGAPHYHILLNRCPNKDLVSSWWYRIVDSKDEKHLKAGTRTERLRKGRAATISYASKYAAKAAQKKVPYDYCNVGRFWGITGDRTRLSADAFVTRDLYASEDVKRCVKRMFDALNKLLNDRYARVYVHEDGLLVVILLTEHAKRMMLAATRMLQRLIDPEGDFYDAEISG